MTAIEIDEALVLALRKKFKDSSEISLLHADARTVDIDASIPQEAPYKLIANLPYYAASPILRRFISMTRKPSRAIVMLQKEVASNIVAKPGKMRLLSVLVQLYGETRIVFSVPPRAFSPVPKVTSAIVRVDPYDRPKIPFIDEGHLLQLLRGGFSAPRKQIHNCLCQGLSIDTGSSRNLLWKAGIDPNRRPGTLSIEEWGALYAEFCTLFPIEGQDSERKNDG